MSGIVSIRRCQVAAYRIPTDFSESDGTFEWDATVLVLVLLSAADQEALGFTYASAATAHFIAETLSPKILGKNAFDIPKIWQTMVQSIRNLGRPGVASMAISAVDSALWDLKGKLLNLPLALLLGKVRDSVPIYGSGGFTSYSIVQLQDQLGRYVDDGISMVKMKVGRFPEEDMKRVKAAREAIGSETKLFVDANGAYSRKEAVEWSRRFSDQGVTWLEEPVNPQDLSGLHMVRDRASPDIEIADGEYGYDLHYFRRMMDAGSVDVLQADASRCGGISAFLQVGALCESRCLPLSSHTAPSLHLQACCASASIRHMEYFHDHARIEHLLFDGAPLPKNGCLTPDLSRCGLGLEFKKNDAQPYLMWGPEG